MAYKKSKFFKPRPRKSSGSQTSQVTAGTPARTRLATDPNSKQSKQTSLSSYFGESSNQHSDGSEESDAGRPTKKSKSETSKTRGKSFKQKLTTPHEDSVQKNKARKRATSKTRLRIPSSSKSDDKDTDSATENDHADKPLSPLLDFDEMEDSADEYQAEKRKRKPRGRAAKPAKKRKTQPDMHVDLTNKPIQVFDESPDNDFINHETVENTRRDEGKERAEPTGRDTLELVRTSLPFEKVTTSWPLISNAGIKQIFGIYENEALSTLSSLKKTLDKNRQQRKGKSKRSKDFINPEDEEVMKTFQEMQQIYYDEVYDRLKYLRIPPSTRQSHYNWETLKNQNERLESVFVPLQQQTADLKAEIEKETLAVKKSERYLKSLKRNSKQQITALEALLKKRANYIKQVPDLSISNTLPDSVEALNMVDSDYEEEAGDYAEFKENACFSESDDDAFDDSEDELAMLDYRDSIMRKAEMENRLEDVDGTEFDETDAEDVRLANILHRLTGQLDILSSNLEPVNTLLAAVDDCDAKLSIM